MTPQAAALAFLPEKRGAFIDGAYRDAAGGRTFESIAPASDEILTSVALCEAAEVDAAVAAAKAAMTRGPWAKSTPGERARMLRRIGDAILRHLEPLARLEALDTGKPISETSTGDIPRAAQNFHFFAELAAHQSCPTFVGDDGATHTTTREPLGVVGLITPWNLPLYLATWKLAPALAQGNAIVLKPAELTPLTAMALGRILAEADVPPGVVNIVQGFGPKAAGEALVQHPDVKAISFTGETTTGSAIMQAAAPTLKKLSFELGGKGATVIFADADLDKAAQTAARAAFRNQGQICLAGSRLIVQRSVAERVVSRIVDEARNLRIGDPLAPETTMGSLVARSHRDKVMSYIDLARRESGVEIVTGGRIPEARAQQGAYLEPTVLTGVAQSSRLVQEEIFGPVLTVQVFDDDDVEGALALLNGTPYGLSCSIWTGSVATARRAATGARTGLVWINAWFLRDLHTAFGGMGKSGVGREGGQYGLDFFCDMKTISWA